MAKKKKSGRGTRKTASVKKDLHDGEGQLQLISDALTAVRETRIGDATSNASVCRGHQCIA